MARNRHSASAYLLLVIAGLLSIWSLGPKALRQEVGESAASSEQRLAKASRRISFRNQAEALAWLHDLATRLARGESPELDPQVLAKACASLDAAAIETFLNDRELWAELPLAVEHWGRWLQLIPLREGLLERLALVDLRRGLRAFPEEAGILLRSAARRDGMAALHDWLACREEWRANPDIYMPTGGSSFAEQPLPTGIYRHDAETEVIAGFLEGWGRSDAEAAWTTAVDRRWLAGKTLGGLIKGMDPGSDWALWAKRFDAIGWKEEGMWYGESSPENDGYLLLATRWVMDDPDSAIAWYRGWPREDSASKHSPGDRFFATTSILPKRVSGEAFLFGSWIGEQEASALQWIGNNPPADRLLGEIVQYTRLGQESKFKVLEIIGEPEIRGDAAIAMASDSAAANTFGPAGDSKFVKLLNSLYALDDLEDDAKERLAEITVSRLKLDE